MCGEHGKDADPILNSRPVRIVIVDDHTIFRDTLRMLLSGEPGFVVAGEASDGEEALRLLKRTEADVLLLDWRMPNLSGRGVLESLCASPAPPRTILLTAEFQREQAPEVFDIGARGLVLKDSGITVLTQSIAAVMAGHYWIVDRSVDDPRGYLQRRSRQNGSTEKDYGLTRRELDIVAAVASGRTNREIAEDLSLSVQTVKHHITRIFDKLGVYTRLELSLFATHHQLSAASAGPLPPKRRRAS